MTKKKSTTTKSKAVVVPEAAKKPLAPPAPVLNQTALDHLFFRMEDMEVALDTINWKPGAVYSLSQIADWLVQSGEFQETDVDYVENQRASAGTIAILLCTLRENFPCVVIEDQDYLLMHALE